MLKRFICCAAAFLCVFTFFAVYASDKSSNSVAFEVNKKTLDKKIYLKSFFILCQTEL